MEIEIVIAVVATGLGLIGGMLIIWRDYRGHRPQREKGILSQTSTGGHSKSSQNEILVGD